MGAEIFKKRLMNGIFFSLQTKGNIHLGPNLSAGLIFLELQLNQEAPEFGLAACPRPPRIQSEFYNFLSLISLRPFGNIEFHMIPFVQRLETTGLNS